MKTDAFEIEDVDVERARPVNREPVTAVPVAIATRETRPQPAPSTAPPPLNRREHNRKIACDAACLMTIVAVVSTLVLTVPGLVIVDQYGCRECYAPVRIETPASTFTSSCTRCGVVVAQLRFDGGGPSSPRFASRVFDYDSSHTDLVWEQGNETKTCQGKNDSAFCDEHGVFQSPHVMSQIGNDLQVATYVSWTAAALFFVSAIIPRGEKLFRILAFGVAWAAGMFFLFAYIPLISDPLFSSWRIGGGPFPQSNGTDVVVFTDRRMTVNFMCVLAIVFTTLGSFCGACSIGTLK